MSFQSMSAELTGLLPGLSPFLADTYINRAWRDVRDARLWAFLQEDAGIFCPVQVTSGTVSITQFSATVVCDATASAALLAISLPSPLDLTALQIRFGGSSGSAQVGPVYSITAVDETDPTAVELTLDRVVQQATDADAGYQCYRCYITPTTDDFLAWQSVVDMTNGWYLRLNYTSSEFDRRDPQRQAQGLAYYLGAFKGNPEDEPKPRYELWPHPTSGESFYARYRRQGEDFSSPTDVPPVIIPESLIVQRTLAFYAYPWANINQQRFDGLKGVNWITQILEAKKQYQMQLLDAKRQDDNQELSTVFARGHGLVTGSRGFKGMTNFPIDSNFMQSHLVYL